MSNMIEANFAIRQGNEKFSSLYRFNVKEENPKDLFLTATNTFDEFLRYKGLQKDFIGQENISFSLQME